MPVDGSGTNPGAFDREKKQTNKQCISQLYKTFGTINSKLIKINQLNFLASYIFFD